MDEDDNTAMAKSQTAAVEEKNGHLTVETSTTVPC
jgi:hypothetical protein